MKWDSVIEQKTAELGRYLVGRTVGLDFSEPSPNLRMSDDKYLRRRILSLAQSKARKLGIGKSTLHHLHNNARGDRPFRIYAKVRSRLIQGEGYDLGVKGAHSDGQSNSTGSV